MCQLCQLTGCYAGCHEPSYFSRQQAQGALGGYLGQQQATRGLSDCFGHRGPVHEPAEEEVFGQYGTAAEADHENIMSRRKRNTKDVSLMRIYQQDELNKERRAAWDRWVERRDFWTED